MALGTGGSWAAAGLDLRSSMPDRLGGGCVGSCAASKPGAPIKRTRLSPIRVRVIVFLLVCADRVERRAGRKHSFGWLPSACGLVLAFDRAGSQAGPGFVETCRL